MDTKGAIKSVRINCGCRIKRVMLLKKKIYLLVNKNTKKIKQDTSIVKVNISKLHQAVIPRTITKFMLITHYVIKYKQQVVTFAHASGLLESTCRREIVMAESCSEALSREIFLHTQSTADMSYRMDTLVKPC